MTVDIRTIVEVLGLSVGLGIGVAFLHAFLGRDEEPVVTSRSPDQRRVQLNAIVRERDRR